MYPKQVPGKGLLCSHKLPDTVLFGTKTEEFGAEGLFLKPVRAMKKWKLTYKGKMRLVIIMHNCV